MREIGRVDTVEDQQAERGPRQTNHLIVAAAGTKKTNHLARFKQRKGGEKKFSREASPNGRAGNVEVEGRKMAQPQFPTKKGGRRARTSLE